MELWDRRMLSKIASVAGTPLYIDTWIEKVVRRGFAKACVRIDHSKPLRPGIDIVAKGRLSWQ